jgi:hypothetical protein
VSDRALPAKNVISLFVWALDRAIQRLTSEDVAELLRAGRRREQLRWLEEDRKRELEALFDALAYRAPGRWTLSGETATHIVTALGGGSSLEQPRPLLILALAIDAAYDAETFTEADRNMHATLGAASPSRSFFDGATNLPPPLGRMTALAAARPWFRNLWLIPDVKRWNALGRFPAPTRVPLDALLIRRLERCQEERVLRVALVTWRRHDPGAVSPVRRRPDCFAIDSLPPAARANLAIDLVERLANAQVHLALLPELGLDETDEAQLRSALSASGRAHPVLVVAGRSHRRDGDRYANEAVVLDAEGEIVFRHEKIEPFYNLTLGLEDILPRASDTYYFADTPVGRLVVNVCRDLGSDLPVLLNRALEATLLAVPCYSKLLDFVAAEAPLLGQRQNAITLAVNPSADSFLEDATYAYAPINGRRQPDRRFNGESRLRQADLPAGAALTLHLIEFTFGPENTARVVTPPSVSL